MSFQLNMNKTKDKEKINVIDKKNDLLQLILPLTSCLQTLHALMQVLFPQILI